MDIFILFKGFHPLALNSLCFLLEHQWTFDPFFNRCVFESLNSPLCEKMDLKIIKSLLERVQICKRCWKTEESAGHLKWTVLLFRTNKGLMNNHHKKLSWIIQITTHSIKNQGFTNFWRGLFLIIAAIFLSCKTLKKNYVKKILLMKVLNKITCVFVWSLLFCWNYSRFHRFCKGFPNFRKPLYIMCKTNKMTIQLNTLKWKLQK